MTTLPKGASISGGAGSLDARLDDMTVEAQLLTTMSLALLAQGAQVKNVALDGDFLQSAPLAPSTFASAEAAVMEAGADLLVRSGELGALAVLLRGAVSTYELTDAALAAAVDRAEYAVGFAIGAQGPGAVVGIAGAGVAAALIAAGGVALGAVGSEFHDSAAEAWIALSRLNPLALMRNPGATLLAFGALSASNFSIQQVVEETSADLKASLEWLMNDTGATPGVLGAVVSTMPGLLAGLSAWAGPISPVVNAALSGLSGGPWPPTTYEQLVDRTIRLFNIAGQLKETGVDVTRIARDSQWDESEVGPPSDVASLAQQLVLVDEAPGRGSHPPYANISIIKTGAHYTVLIPSTLDWDMQGTDAPNDLTSNLQALSSQHQSQLTDAVLKAMKQDHVPAGASVMLAGFSQGGIAAAALTEHLTQQTSPQYRVTNVLTLGAPIGTFRIPESTQVLSFEHSGDPVPALSGVSNPAESNWTTVKSDVNTGAGSDGTATLDSHNALNYANTVKSWSKYDPSVLDSFGKAAEGYFTPGDAPVPKGDYVHDYAAVRAPLAVHE